ncbi:BMC domain-containing protein [Romboutsia maritimum]|uniref:BMC domain-containing protein n=1 Tax=Romboutsia maritimum TaxID=2020948 RepID=A0A371ISN3_9FIRM|nr:BMC domain-containing protein [Romboutsia maritimum]RDY23496.1 BMC domain-containing protein [Romboutsia maritimum]
MRALGLVEVYGYIAAIEAADSALKAANVELLDIEKVKGGIVTVQLIGDVGAIKAAVEAANESASRIGTVLSNHVIPRVDDDLIGKIIKLNKVEEIEAKEINEVKEINETDEVKLVDEVEVVNEISEVNELEEVDENLENDICEEETEQITDDINIEKELTKAKLLEMNTKQLRNLLRKLDKDILWKDINALKKNEIIDKLINITTGGEDR